VAIFAFASLFPLNSGARVHDALMHAGTDRQAKEGLAVALVAAFVAGGIGSRGMR
jgi:hypothetical protein